MENIQDILDELKQQQKERPSLFTGVRTEKLQQASQILEEEFSEELTPNMDGLDKKSP